MLVKETFDRPYIDLEAVASLAESAQLLGHLPTTADLLLESSHSLRHLPDSAEMLSSSWRLAELPDAIHRLWNAADTFERLPGHIDELRTVLRPLEDLPDHISSLRHYSDDFERSSASVRRSIDSVNNQSPDYNYLSRADKASERLAATSAQLAQNIEDMAEASALALQATTRRPPDRLTYVLWGMAVGAIIVIAVVVMIWPSSSTG